MRAVIIILLGAMLLSGCKSYPSKKDTSSFDLPAIRALYAAEPVTLDGKLSDKIWEQAEWVTLDCSRPARPGTKEEWERLYPVAGAKKELEEQFAQKVKAAAVWSEKGLYFAFKIEDADVQGKYTRDNEWIWLEDVVEVFLSKGPKMNICEIQINPSNAVLINQSKSKAYLKFRPESAASVDGTINDSKNVDRSWNAELFLPWFFLEAADLAAKPEGIQKTTKCSNIRFAAWDLTIYSQLRINRFTSPGKANPHHPEHYRPLLCFPPKK